MSAYDVHYILQSVWPEWTVVQLLGCGSYGNVYKIKRNTSTGSDDAESALKVIHVPQNLPDIVGGAAQLYLHEQQELCDSIVADLSREIAVLDSLKGCANVVQLEDHCIYKHTDSIGYTILIRMELLHPIRELYPMTECEIQKLGIDICSALEVCAERNIIHRDIKPGNIFIDDAGNYKLGDFGISKIMQFSDSTMTQRSGTPNYMAPEVVKGQKYDFRADMYSLGMVLYLLLNELKQPFCSTDKQLLSYHDRFDAYTRRMSGEKLPAPKHASKPFAEIIQRICAFSPEDRYSDIKTVKQALCELDKEGYERTPLVKRISPLIPKITAAFLGCALIFLGGYLITEKIGADPVISDAENSEEDTVSADGESIVADEAELFEYTYNKEENSYTLTKLLDESVIEAVIPETYNGLPVTAIGADAFAYSMIESVTIPESVTRIEKNAFFLCEHLKSIYIPASVVEMQLDRVDKRYTSPFVLCVNLSSIEVAPENPVYHSSGNCIIETETKRLVQGCYTSVIPDDGSVEIIGAGAFSGIVGLEILVIPEGITTIEEGAFWNAGIRDLTIPASTVDIQKHGFVFCRVVEYIKVAEGNPKYHSAGNCLIETAAKTVIKGSMNSVIPDDGSVDTIGEFAFYSLRNLTSLTIPEGIIYIARDALSEIPLKEINIPASVLDLEENAFDLCPTLEVIHVNNRNPIYVSRNNCIIKRENAELVVGGINAVIPKGVKIIGAHAFYGRDLKEIVIPDTVEEIMDGVFAYTEIKTIVIPEGITELDKYVFNTCTELETIYLPRSLEFININAFINCENLKTVYYGGSTQEWWDIDMETGNDALQNAVIMYNYKTPED